MPIKDSNIYKVIIRTAGRTLNFPELHCARACPCLSVGRRRQLLLWKLRFQYVEKSGRAEDQVKGKKPCPSVINSASVCAVIGFQFLQIMPSDVRIMCSAQPLLLLASPRRAGGGKKHWYPAGSPARTCRS